MPPLDPALIGAAAAGLPLMLLVWKLKRDKRLLAERIAALEAVQSPSEQELEFRIERFQVLWYPVVSYSPSKKTVLKSKAGLPHCKACAVALTSPANKGWKCSRCAAVYPESLADVGILDSIAKEARQHFLERHHDYR